MSNTPKKPPKNPKFILIAGPNGSGKSTHTDNLIKQGYRVLNPDTIAKQINPQDMESAAIPAARQTLNGIKDSIDNDQSFAVETTLSSKSYLKFVDQAKAKGYDIDLAYIALDSPERSISRVQHRVSEGGHHVSDEDITRRYARSMSNLPDFYDKADDKVVIDNSGREPELILHIEKGQTQYISPNPPTWAIKALGPERLREAYKNKLAQNVQASKGQQQRVKTDEDRER